jgi:hypothetical protein
MGLIVAKQFRPCEPGRGSEAFSIALASAFWVGIGGAIVAAVIVLLLREEPMRQTFEFAETD